MIGQKVKSRIIYEESKTFGMAYGSISMHVTLIEVNSTDWWNSEAFVLHGRVDNTGDDITLAQSSEALDVAYPYGPNAIRRAIGLMEEYICKYQPAPAQEKDLTQEDSPF